MLDERGTFCTSHWVHHQQQQQQQQQQHLCLRCPFVLRRWQERPSRVLKIVGNLWAVEALPRTPLGSSQRSPRTSSWWEGKLLGCLYTVWGSLLPQPALGVGPRFSTFQWTNEQSSAPPASARLFGSVKAWLWLLASSCDLAMTSLHLWCSRCCCLVTTYNCRDEKENYYNERRRWSGCCATLVYELRDKNPDMVTWLFATHTSKEGR